MVNMCKQLPQKQYQEKVECTGNVDEGQENYLLQKSVTGEVKTTSSENY